MWVTLLLTAFPPLSLPKTFLTALNVEPCWYGARSNRLLDVSRFVGPKLQTILLEPETWPCGTVHKGRPYRNGEADLPERSQSAGGLAHNRGHCLQVAQGLN